MNPTSAKFFRLASVLVLLVTTTLLAFSPILISTPALAAPALQATATLAGAQALGSKGGVFNCAGWTVTVPANVVPNGGLIHCGSFNPDKAPAAPAGYGLLRHTVNVNIYDNKGQWITNFNPPLTFCFAHTDAELAAAGGDVRNFNILTAPIAGIWSVLLTEVTPQTKLVCARTNHLTLFDLAISGGTAPAVLATAASASGTPVPTVATTTIFLTFNYSYRHIVQAGETLFRIALNYKTSVVAIQAANGLSSNYIFVGQSLLIPTNTPYTGSAPVVITQVSTVNIPTLSAPRQTTYVVQAGDNLFRIALRFNTTVSAIQAANGLTSTYIFVGQVLVIPGR